MKVLFPRTFSLIAGTELGVLSDTFLQVAVSALNTANSSHPYKTLGSLYRSFLRTLCGGHAQPMWWMWAKVVSLICLNFRLSWHLNSNVFFSGKISVSPVFSLAIRAQNSVSRSSGFSVLPSKWNRFRQHHEVQVYLRLFLNKHSMSFKDLVYTLTKSLTAVTHLSIPTHAQLQRHRLKFIKNHLKTPTCFGLRPSSGSYNVLAKITYLTTVGCILIVVAWQHVVLFVSGYTWRTSECMCSSCC